jgi:hypothetical protein
MGSSHGAADLGMIGDPKKFNPKGREKTCPHCISIVHLMVGGLAPALGPAEDDADAGQARDGGDHGPEAVPAVAASLLLRSNIVSFKLYI